MTKDDIKEEIAKYVQALETNYNDTIRELKMQVERIKSIQTLRKTSLKVYSLTA
jgi:hypothetical protein